MRSALPAGALQLHYLFAPGDPADGVTLDVPLELLNTLDAERLSWLVPGLLPELVLEFLRSLPKPLRRALTPLPQFADAALAELPRSRPVPAGTPGSGTGERCGVTLKADDLTPGRLPDHLRMRVRVLDADGKVTRLRARPRSLAGPLGRRRPGAVSCVARGRASIRRFARLDLW